MKVFRLAGKTQDAEDQFECRHEFFADANQPRAHEAFFTEIETDEGCNGYSIGGSREVLEFGRLLVGEDPRNIEFIWEKMANARYARLGHIHTMGILDLALWDLNGKILDLPVYRLLGGPMRDKIPAYAAMLGFSTEPDAAARRSAQMVSEGFEAIKWYVKENESDGARGMERILALASSVRATVGPHVRIMLDFANSDPSKNSVAYIAKLAQALEKYDIAWLEEPLHFDDLDAYQHLARLTSIPLACGEHVYTRWQYKKVLEDRAISILQPDVYFAAGLTEVRKIFQLIASHGATIVPHANESCIHSSHLVFTMPQRHCPMLEYGIKLNRRFQHFFKQQYLPKGGWFELPTGPGFGYEIDPRKVVMKEYL